MPSKSRGGLSKREVAAKKSGTTIAKKQAGKTSTSGTGDGLTSQYKALMKKYESALKPSKEETKATDALNALTTSAEQGIAKSGQEVIPMGLITGQQKAITEQLSLKSAPLSRTIAAEQAKRGAASDILSAEASVMEKYMAAQPSPQTTTTKKAKSSGGSVKLKTPTVSAILSTAAGWYDAFQKAQAAGIPTDENSAFDLAAKKKWAVKTPKRTL